jgi:FtsZ-binding cell division protein ZapB
LFGFRLPLGGTNIQKEKERNLSLDSLSQLENKVDTLVSTVTTLREEKNRLSDEIESLKKTNEEKQKKLDSAADKVQGLLSKLESVA